MIYVTKKQLIVTQKHYIIDLKAVLILNHPHLAQLVRSTTTMKGAVSQMHVPLFINACFPIGFVLVSITRLLCIR